MKIQFIVSGDGWVLDKHAKILADAFDAMDAIEGNAAIVLRDPMPDIYDITYLMNYAQIRKLTVSNPNVQPAAAYGKVVSMMTHFEPDMIDLWSTASAISDALVSMSESTEASIHEACRHKSYKIPLPVPNYITKRRPRIGIAGIRNAANEHRKGWDLVDRLRNDHPEWEITTTGGRLSEAEMLVWYRSLDLYLCPSRYEGGPMGVIEAAAMGVPYLVMPAGVGWCSHVCLVPQEVLYNAGDYDDMECAICGAFSMNEVKDTYTEAAYIQAHRELFQTLLLPTP